MAAKAKPQRPVDVIVVGAGAAGLSAARSLSDAGRSVLILEAGNTVGGRIRTYDDPKFPVPVDMGAEFIHGRPEATWDLVREAGLLAVDLPFEHFQKRKGHLTRLDDFSGELDKVMSGLSKLKHD